MSLESGWLRVMRLAFSPRSSMGEKHTPLGVLWEGIGLGEAKDQKPASGRDTAEPEA
jgi:hypothetical protein